MRVAGTTVFLIGEIKRMGIAFRFALFDSPQRSTFMLDC